VQCVLLDAYSLPSLSELLLLASTSSADPSSQAMQGCRDSSSPLALVSSRSLDGSVRYGQVGAVINGTMLRESRALIEVQRGGEAWGSDD